MKGWIIAKNLKCWDFEQMMLTWWVLLNISQKFF